MTDERGLREGLGDGAQSCIIRQAEEIAALNEQVAALREALKPFAAYADRLNNLPDTARIAYAPEVLTKYPDLNVRDCMRARAALAATEPKGGDAK